MPLAGLFFYGRVRHQGHGDPRRRTSPEWTIPLVGGVMFLDPHRRRAHQRHRWVLPRRFRPLMLKTAVMVAEVGDRRRLPGVRRPAVLPARRPPRGPGAARRPQFPRRSGGRPSTPARRPAARQLRGAGRWRRPEGRRRPRRARRRRGRPPRPRPRPRVSPATRCSPTAAPAATARTAAGGIGPSLAGRRRHRCGRHRRHRSAGAGCRASRAGSRRPRSRPSPSSWSTSSEPRQPEGARGSSECSVDPS